VRAEVGRRALLELSFRERHDHPVYLLFVANHEERRHPHHPPARGQPRRLVDVHPHHLEGEGAASRALAASMLLGRRLSIARAA